MIVSLVEADHVEEYFPSEITVAAGWELQSEDDESAKGDEHTCCNLLYRDCKVWEACEAFES